MASEAAQAEETAVEAKFQAVKKKISVDQAMYSRFLQEDLQDARSRHVAKMFHERSQETLGQTVAKRFSETFRKVAHSSETQAILAMGNVVRGLVHLKNSHSAPNQNQPVNSLPLPTVACILVSTEFRRGL